MKKDEQRLKIHRHRPRIGMGELARPGSPTKRNLHRERQLVAGIALAERRACRRGRDRSSEHRLRRSPSATPRSTTSAGRTPTERFVLGKIPGRLPQGHRTRPTRGECLDRRERPAITGSSWDYAMPRATTFTDLYNCARDDSVKAKTNPRGGQGCRRHRGAVGLRRPTVM